MTINIEVDVNEDVDETYLVCKMEQEYQNDIIKVDPKYIPFVSSMLRGMLIFTISFIFFQQPMKYNIKLKLKCKINCSVDIQR